MIKPQEFYNILLENGIEFFTGVPDSLLKDICAFITDNTDSKKNIIAANEGNSIALATGYYLATGKVPLVYMQNSGLGNSVNPLLSLTDKEVYSIPMLLMIGWRGEPGIKDEPQHIKQGKVTLDLLDTMGIEYRILPDSIDEFNSTIKEIMSSVTFSQSPVALVVKKGTFEKYKLNNDLENPNLFSREEAIRTIVEQLDHNDIVVSTTGKTSRELFEIRNENGEGHEKDFLTVGSMGHANQIALGIALEQRQRQVFCLDGDGAAIMHAGGFGIIGDLAPNNFKHIILNNGAHESVGGQPTIGFKMNFVSLVKSFGYKQSFQVNNIEGLRSKMSEFRASQGPALLEVKISKGSRDDLGRPTESPLENKKQFMNFIQK